MLTQLLLVFAPLLACAPAETLFRKTTFDDALAAAKKEQKIVMIDFFTTWCGPCKKLDTTTWRDPAVLAWAAKQCVALKVDAEKDVALAKRFRINAYPTIVLLKADGSEFDRIVGYRDAPTFLAEVASAAGGKTSVDRAKDDLAGHEQDPMARQQYADELMNKTRFEEALTEYLWCFDHGSEKPAYSGVRRSFLLSDIARLGQQYPPALKALEQRRDAAVARLTAGSDSYDDLADVSALNRYLNTPDLTLALYDRLRNGKPLSTKLLPAVQRELLGPLAKAKRYTDLVELVGDPTAFIDQRIKVLDYSSKQLEGDARDDESKAAAEATRNQFKVSIVNEGCILYEALLATARTEVAAQVADRLTKLAPTGLTYVALMTSAVQAGAVDTAQAIGQRGIATLPEPEQKKVRKALDRLAKSEQ